MNKNIIFGVVITVVLIGGFLFFTNQSHPKLSNTPNSTEQTANIPEGKLLVGYNRKEITRTMESWNKDEFSKQMNALGAN